MRLGYKLSLSKKLRKQSQSDQLASVAPVRSQPRASRALPSDPWSSVAIRSETAGRDLGVEGTLNSALRIVAQYVMQAGPGCGTQLIE
jgi:hypothetical protein